MSSNHEGDPSIPGGQQPYWQPGRPPDAPQPQQPYGQPGHPQQPYEQPSQHPYPPQPSPQQAWGQPAYPQQPQPPGYPQQPSGYAPQPSGYAPQPVWSPPVPTYPYAAWLRRVGAYLIDFAPALVAQIPFWIGYVMFYVRLIQLSSSPSTTSSEDVFSDLTGSALIWMIIGFVLMLAAIGWQWYNRWLIGGRTGQSMGKRVLQTKLVAEVNGQPIGPVNAFLRDLLHVLDGAAYIGFLWPLWDAKRQTFSDMIMKTVVVDLRSQLDPNAAAVRGQHPYGPA